MKDTFKIFVEVVNLANSLQKLNVEQQNDLTAARDKAVEVVVERLLQNNTTYQEALNTLETLDDAISDGGFYQSILNKSAKKIGELAMNAKV